MEIVPSTVAGPLSTAANAGELVVYGGRLAIVGLSQGGGEQPASISLAVYDNQTRKFMLAAADPSTEVMAFKGGHVLEPDVQSATMLGTLGPISTDELFFDGETPLVAIHDTSQRWRTLRLATGEVRSAAAGNRPCFKRWRLGVRDADGKPRWLLDIK